MKRIDCGFGSLEFGHGQTELTIAICVELCCISHRCQWENTKWQQIAPSPKDGTGSLHTLTSIHPVSVNLYSIPYPEEA